MALNYSKWDHIEISDDEDDVHPNIDTGSLFRWRHQARLERMEKTKKEQEEFDKDYTSHQQKMVDMRNKIKNLNDAPEAEMEKLKLEMSELEKQEHEWKQKEEELKKKERLTPWNIDTICHEGKSKTVINKTLPKKTILTEEEKAEKQKIFMANHKEAAKKFGMLQKYEDSQQYLLDNPYLKSELMNHVAHQTIVMQFILELAKQMDIDPRNCTRPFFSRMRLAEKQYIDAFNDELENFKTRIKTRAEVKLEEAMKEYEKEERKKRLGPKGLDPVEVFELLPKEMQECFESQDVQALQAVIAKMDRSDAEYYMEQCVGSGLWIPNAKDKGGDGDQEEETYEQVGEEVVAEETDK